MSTLGRPSPPMYLSVQYVKGDNVINISWTATTMMGVNQSYIIVFNGAYMIKTTELYYTCQDQQITPYVKCGTFLAFVKAVNEAGESDPSNNVSIPSLPDVGPVTASLKHQVWKYDGEIRVNVSFQVRGVFYSVSITLSARYFSVSLILYGIPCVEIPGCTEIRTNWCHLQRVSRLGGEQCHCG